MFRWFREWADRQRVLNAPPKVVATLERRVRWIDADDQVDEITFFLKVDGRGRRSYSVHEMGYARVYEKHRDFLAPVLLWLAGGPLPSRAHLVQPSGFSKLTVVK